jgi:Ubiquitin-Binding Zinc Finger/impB/mucB/samB family C-terminal domain
LWPVPLQTLQSKFGDSGKWIYDICRGICNEIVEPPQPPKQLSSHKDLNDPVTSMMLAQRWMNTLSSELFARITEDAREYKRWPQSLTLNIKRSNSSTHTKSTSMPIKEGFARERLVAKAWGMFTPDMMPCVDFQLVCGGMSKDAHSASLHKWFSSAEGGVNDRFAQWESANPPPKIEQKIEIPVEAGGGITKWFKKVDPLLEKSESEVKRIHSTDEEKPSKDQVTPAKRKESIKESESSTESIETYFQKAAQTSDDPDLSARCPRCNVYVLFEALEEHMDFHYAMELHSREKGKRRKDGNGRVTDYFTSVF